MCNIPIEEKKTEAMRRMRKMNYYGQSRKQFYDKGFVMINEPPLGAHYYIDEDEELVRKINEMQEKDNILVYAVVRAFTEFGKMDSFLFVEDHKEEWEYFDEDIKDGIIMSYTFNRDYPDCSEYGSIGIKPTIAAGIMRTF